jgi:hypothetical protein
MMPIPLNSTEIRWFFPHSPPEAIQTWFGSLGAVENRPPRTDIYLPGLGLDLGIKLREGRLEIKRLTADHGSRKFAGGVEGNVRAWTKSSFELTPDQDPPADWIAVEKSRRILYFDSGPGGEITPAAPGTIPQAGGGVELTLVTSAEGRRWWTFGIEVVGPETDQADILSALADQLFSPPVPLSLPVSASQDYPSWLAGLSSPPA